MNVLMVNPTYPDTFWSFKHAIRFVSKKATFPPLGLLTMAAMLPGEWSKRLCDMNVQRLRDRDLLWADYVFLGGMSIQERSAREVIERCNGLGRPVVAGGPLFTERAEEFDGVAHFVLNEAELTLPPFLDDLRRGHAQHIYRTASWADITKTPVPLWHLINRHQYSNMNIQYSRGCPYDCEFCEITVLYGRVPRTKTREQLLGEFDSLYASGWRGDVFLVDDNFIGNKSKLKKEILPALIDWQKRMKHPFSLNTEVSINLSDDEELMDLMVKAGFSVVFVGIESPNEESLIECQKIPNRRRDLVASVHTLQKRGLQVQGGFIVGFDSDPASIFGRMVEFIQESGIVTAMVGLLNAPIGSKLHKRLQGEGRLLKAMSGDNTDTSMNFQPKMNLDVLVKGYRSILENIYSPKQYYARVKSFLRTYQPPKVGRIRIKRVHLQAFVKSTVRLGIFGKERVEYWKLFFWSLFRRPRLFPMAITFSIYGFHFRRIVEQHMV